MNADGITNCKAFTSALILKRLKVTLFHEILHGIPGIPAAAIYAAGPSWLLSRAAFALGSTVQTRRTVAS